MSQEREEKGTGYGYGEGRIMNIHELRFYNNRPVYVEIDTGANFGNGRIIFQRQGTGAWRAALKAVQKGFKVPFWGFGDRASGELRDCFASNL